ncbi:unnamed protein product [Didymodactylos carnosus]|uniref:Death-associated protein n=1 Tax=Didymodactylos carnosus TaxID=1234261 RepID=A0A814WH89_9BILA|nr:unnamed protein product [Didymodactylos carnosus]CAF1198497.1 unnamed protein product [Didymodactylos carnosus]CAF3569568.1 unnamed protein product [Didymodactylos carnosus]CAF3963104.1 unnamed protein product [Didymodactylos carnosus]
MSDEPVTVNEKVENDLKAGHAPALKVGGMRVAQPRRTSQNEDKDKKAKSGANEGTGSAGDSEGGENAQEAGETAAEGEEQQATGTAVSQRVAGQMVSGTFVPIQEAFPTEAMKHMQEKPIPKHDYHSGSKFNQTHIVMQQPRNQ